MYYAYLNSVYFEFFFGAYYKYIQKCVCVCIWLVRALKMHRFVLRQYLNIQISEYHNHIVVGVKMKWLSKVHNFYFQISSILFAYLTFKYIFPSLVLLLFIQNGRVNS